MSNDKLFYISNGYKLHYGVIGVRYWWKMGGELNKCCVYVPKPQAQAFQLPVHISYFLQNYKRQTP